MDEKSLVENEAALFDRLRQRSGSEGLSLVTDGVITPSRYLNGSFKIALVLKEVNDPGGGGWDLREFIRNGGRPQTWNNLARWIYCIRERQQEVPWSTLEKPDEQFRREMLADVCVINMKKLPGGHTSKHAEVDEWALGNRGDLKKQYELYEPKLTICCGTGYLLYRVLELKNEWSVTSRGIPYFSDGMGGTAVVFPHPEARVPNCILTYAIRDAVLEILGPERADENKRPS